MAKKKDVSKEQVKEAENAAREISKLAGRTVGEVWTIFVRKSIVKGLSITLVASALIFGGVWFMLGLPVNPIGMGLFAVALALLFIAINYLGNPAYYAMTDITEVIKSIGKKGGSDGWNLN